MTYEEECEIKEGAYEEFVSWVDSNSVKYPASADLEEMRTKTTKDDMTDSDLKTTTVLMDKTINFLKESEDFDHKEYIKRVAETIIENVDNESYCPDLKRVFDNKGAAIIDNCKKARNEIPEERPTDKYNKLFKFPMLTLDRNVVKSDEILKNGEVKISEWCFKTAYHHPHMKNESFMDCTSKNAGGDEGLKMYKDDR